MQSLTRVSRKNLTQTRRVVPPKREPRRGADDARRHEHPHDGWRRRTCVKSPIVRNLLDRCPDMVRACMSLGKCSSGLSTFIHPFAMANYDDGNVGGQNATQNENALA